MSSDDSQPRKNRTVSNQVAETDQYDRLLRAMAEGLIISVNNEISSALPSDELHVESSSDDETRVRLSGPNKTEYQIHRDRRGELVYSEVTTDGLDYQDEVITIEVIGIQ